MGHPLHVLLDIVTQLGRVMLESRLGYLIPRRAVDPFVITVHMHRVIIVGGVLVVWIHSHHHALAVG